jgi:hypothetical protein
MKLLNKFIALGLFGVLITACGGSKGTETNLESSEPSATYIDTAARTVEDTVLFKFDFAIANIPSPASLIGDIQRMNKPYDKTILNEPAKAQGFPSEFQKAVNLGIYNIDMAYAVVNNMGADVLEYLKCIIILGDGLGLKNTITSMVGKRAESNLSNKDSLFAVLDDIYEKSDKYLRTNKRVYVASLVFTGSWVEILYLTTKASEGGTAEVKQKAYKMVWDQRFHLGNIINLLNDHKGENEYQLLQNDLKEVHKLISSVKDVNEMTDEKFRTISDKIFNLRIRLSN